MENNGYFDDSFTSSQFNFFVCYKKYYSQYNAVLDSLRTDHYISRYIHKNIFIHISVLDNRGKGIRVTIAQSFPIIYNILYNPKLNNINQTLFTSKQVSKLITK